MDNDVRSQRVFRTTVGAVVAVHAGLLLVTGLPMYTASAFFASLTCFVYSLTIKSKQFEAVALSGLILIFGRLADQVKDYSIQVRIAVLASIAITLLGAALLAHRYRSNGNL